MRERDLKTCRPAHVALALSGLALAAIVAFDALPWLRGPAPYPPEWQWTHRAAGPAGSRLPAVLAALLLAAAVAVSATRAAAARPRLAGATLLAAATALGLALHVSLAAGERPGALRSLAARAESASITSYHSVATSGAAADPRAFVLDHARLLPEIATGAKHAATHPPGYVLWYRAALAACERWPFLVEGLLDAAGAPGRAARGRLELASALLGALGLGLLAALGAWAVASVAGTLGLEALAAARVGALWPLVPAVAVFSPAHDAALATLVVCCVALQARAGPALSPARAGVRVAAAGTCGGLALFASYGAAAFLGIGSLAATAAASARPGGARRAFVVAGSTGLLSVALAFGVPTLLGGQPVAALRTALGIHAAEYTAPRSHALWLAFNPLDFALFLGLPLFAVLVGGVRRSLRTGVLHREPLASGDRFRLALAAGVVALWLAGLTRGEVGRLWLPVMPLALVAALADAPAGGRPCRDAALALALAAVTLAIGWYWSV